MFVFRVRVLALVAGGHAALRPTANIALRLPRSGYFVLVNSLLTSALVLIINN
jgi:hypothetical protein